MAYRDYFAGPLGRRALAATLLSILSPGLGHLYLGTWMKAAAWLALGLVAVVAFVPDLVVAAVTVADPAVLEAAATGGSLGLVVAAALLVRVVGALDALATLARRQAADTDYCPSCDRALGVDVGFCHWCLARVEDE